MSAVSGPPGVREPHLQDPAPPPQARRWETPERPASLLPIPTRERRSRCALRATRLPGYVMELVLPLLTGEYFILDGI